MAIGRAVPVVDEDVTVAWLAIAGLAELEDPIFPLLFEEENKERAVSSTRLVADFTVFFMLNE